MNKKTYQQVKICEYKNSHDANEGIRIYITNGYVVMQTQGVGAGGGSGRISGKIEWKIYVTYGK